MFPVINSHWFSSWRDTLPPAMCAIAIFSFTRAYYPDDTPYYVTNVVNYQSGDPESLRQIWEFGHLLWRPFFLGLFHFIKPLQLLAPAHWNDYLFVTALMIGVSLICGVITIVLLYDMMHRVIASRPLACALAALLCCSNAFLNYSHSGATYVPGLMFLTLGCHIGIRAAEEKALTPRNGFLVGVPLALGTLVWVPYVLSVFGVVLLALVWNRPLSGFRPILDARRVTFALWAIGTAVGLTAVVMGVTTVGILHIRSPSGLLAWIMAASHDQAPYLSVVRMVAGFCRTFLDLGNDGVMLKRYLFQDPYSTITFPELVRSTLWKFATFYLFFSVLLWAAWRHQKGPRALLGLAAAAVPQVVFAVFIYESGSSERYLPLFPFVALVLSAAIDARLHKSARVTILALLGCMALLNLSSMESTSLRRGWQNERERVSLLREHLSASSWAAQAYGDTLGMFVIAYPFDAANRGTSLRLGVVATPGVESNQYWRRSFAARVLETWGESGEAWVSKRLLADQPRAHWGWVEGDDPRLRWEDFPAFFTQLAFDAEIGGFDGFLRVANTGGNRRILEAFSKQEE